MVQSRTTPVPAIAMTTLKLKKTAGKTAAPQAARPPLRSGGMKKRPTLAQAEAERAERAARRDAPAADERPARVKPREDAPRGNARPPQRPDSPRSAPSSRAEARNDRPRGRFEPQFEAPRGPNTAFGARPKPAPAWEPERPARGDDRRARPPATERRPLPPASPTGLRADKRHLHPAAKRAREIDDEDDFDTPPEHAPGSMRLSKRISELKIASRREADEWIPKGWVRVDGEVVKELGSRVMPGQQITIDAKARNMQAQKVTVLINKPVGYVSGQAEDGYEPASVLIKPDNQWHEDQSGIRWLHTHLRGLAPAGRLDIDSVGLLVLTQDGRVARQLIGEDSEIEKEYLVRVRMRDGGTLPESGLALLRHGLELDDQPLKPAQVEWVNEDQLRFVLREGRKRQIRRMCEGVGLEVLGLKRVRIGGVMLGDLPPGQWRYLRYDEHFEPRPGKP